MKLDGEKKKRMKVSAHIRALVPVALRLKWNIGCTKCGEVHDRFHSSGNLDYCTDCWPGYDNCAHPGCGHFRCEHSVGETWKTIYVKDGQEGNVGDEQYMREGCMNAGCGDCPGFVEPGTYTRLSDSGYARRAAYWALSEMPNVTDVEGSVEISVNINIKLDVYSYEAREAVYKTQFELMEKHPNVLFNFQIVHGISDHG
jgi:hypothetical protein